VSSESYQKLHTLSHGVKTDSKGDERIAVYLLVIPARFKWDARNAQEMKDRVLDLIPGLTDSEWKNIHEKMIDIVADSLLRAKRLDWIWALDTLREFERE
jgi:hypothetical protein